MFNLTSEFPNLTNLDPNQTNLTVLQCCSHEKQRCYIRKPGSGISLDFLELRSYNQIETRRQPNVTCLPRLAVDAFTSSGLDALGQKLGRLDMARAADISRQACAGPNSLVLALLYLDRLRKRNPDYLTTVSSADLFLVSLMVASKFLHDDGEEDEVFNDEWATSGGMDTKELNRLEVRFLAALDWRIFVDQQEFAVTLHRLESDIAAREMAARGGGATYSDLRVLGSGEQAAQMLALLAQAALKVTTVCLTTYAAGLLTLLGTAAALSRTPLGPAAVSSSIRTLASACSGLESDQNLVSEDGKSLSTADLVTASLLVATLTSAPLAGGQDEDSAEDNLVLEEERRQLLNHTRSLWLSEYSEARRSPDGRPPDHYTSPLYSDKPDSGTYSRPSLSSLLQPTWEDLEAPAGWGMRCPVLRWGAQATAWPALGLALG